MSGRILGLATLVVLVLATVATARHDMALLRANRVLWVAETQAGMLAGQGARARPVLMRNVSGLTRAQRAAPADPRLPHAIGSYYLLLEQLGQAEIWYRRALEIEPRAETYLNLARVVERRDRRDEAAELYRTAVRLTPALRRQVPRWVGAANAVGEADGGRGGGGE
jgi:tetratricopeptide (TPR) repeat protein